MTDFTDLPTAIDALRLALIEDWTQLDQPTREELFKLGGLGVSPVDRLVKHAEIIYAKAEAGEALPTKSRLAAAGAFRAAAAHGFHGLQTEGRGEKAADILEGKPVPANEHPQPRLGLVPDPSPAPPTTIPVPE